MKKLAFFLALVLAVTTLSSSALAATFLGSQCNEATFETLEEAHQSGPKATEQLDNQTGIAMFDGPARTIRPWTTIPQARHLCTAAPTCTAAAPRPV